MYVFVVSSGCFHTKLIPLSFSNEATDPKTKKGHCFQWPFVLRTGIEPVFHP